MELGQFIQFPSGQETSQAEACEEIAGFSRIAPHWPKLTVMWLHVNMICVPRGWEVPRGSVLPVAFALSFSSPSGDTDRTTSLLTHAPALTHMLHLDVSCKHSPHAEMVARRALALGGSLERWTHTALNLLHNIHHVPGFQSHLRRGALLVVGDGSVRLQDDGTRDVCGAEVRHVPFPSPLAQKYSISGRPKASQDSPKHPSSIFWT